MGNGNNNFTQAFNFVSALQGGVDPRTGLYSTTMKLGSLLANAGMGPVLDIALTYSPAQPDNTFSLGAGISLGVSTYDDTNHHLQLSTGESYRTYITSQGRVMPYQHNIEHFTLNRHEAGYLLQHKSGMVEHMHLCHADTFISSELETPLGYRMKLVWSNHEGLRLEKVLDGKGNVLCAFRYAGEKILITLLRPDSEREQPLTLILSTENDYLKKMTLGKMNWLLDYDPVFGLGGKRLLQRITYPTGGMEEVTYGQHVGHVYPVVHSHTVKSGFGSPTQVVRYHYSENNFMGSNLPDHRVRADQDGLYEYAESYLYWSQATHEHTDLISKTARNTIIKRTYNNFHLLIAQATTCGRAVHLTETEYNIKHHEPFSKQSNTLQFPRSVTQTWQHGREERRTEITHYDYDVHGNLIRTVSPNGAVTELSYYPLAGEGDACPPSPHKLTTLLKSKTVFSPLSKIWSDECAARTLYTYKKLDTLSQSHDAYAVIKNQEITFVGHVTENVKSTLSRMPGAFNWSDYAAVMMSCSSSVINTDTKSMHFGREISRVSVIYAADGAKYCSVQTQEYRCQKGILTVTRHSKSHDGLEITGQFASSVYTGICFCKTDALGDKEEYVYDPVGRLKHVIFNGDKPDATVSARYEYHLPDPQTGTPALTILTDERGGTSRISYDGLGREIKYELMNPDRLTDRQDNRPLMGHQEGWYVVKSVVWDDLGRRYSEVSHDYLPQSITQASQSLTFTMYQEWDDWGRVSAVKGNDGVTHHTETDMVGMVTSSWLSAKRPVLSSRVRTFYAPVTHTPVKKEMLTPEGTVYAVTSQAYDGSGRLRTGTDEKGNTTAWDYDALGRVIRTRYADGSVIRKEYAAFSLGDHVSHLAVITAKGDTLSLGTQRWDGLGRLTETVSGGRKTAFYYQYAWQLRPDRQVGPDGVEVRLVIDPHLGGAITGIQAGEINHTFRYDNRLRQMVNAEVARAGTSQEWARYPSGRLRKETTRVVGGGPFSTEWNYSLCGHPVRIMSNGSQQTLTYSVLGHPVEIQENDVTVTIRYDDLGRTLSWKAQERLKKSWLKTTRALDPYGRETSRHLQHSNGFQRVITQTWQVNNLLSGRTCCNENGACQLKELFKYDNRNRLIKYSCEGPELPTDPYGNPIKGQTFIMDALNNIVVCSTLLASGEIDEARYFFSDKDPCQLTGVTHGAPHREQESYIDKSNVSKTPLGYSRMVSLEYDAAGRMTLDDNGRTLKYDALGRLSGITGGSYGYDAQNRLVYQKVDKENQAHRLYYRAEQLVSEWITAGEEKPDAARDQQVRLIYAPGGCVAQESQLNGQVTTMLLGTDAKKSVIAQIENDEVCENVYMPYGYFRRDE